MTIDDDVALRLKEIAHQRRTSMKAVLNDLLRRGLSAQERASEGPRFVVEPHAGGLQPGVDPGRLNQILDELEAKDFVPGVGSGS